jgi:hypothetical protein
MTSEAILSVARLAADLLLELVPHDDAHVILTDASIRRANAIANAAEAAKFGSAPTEPSER